MKKVSEITSQMGILRCKRQMKDQVAAAAKGSDSGNYPLSNKSVTRDMGESHGSGGQAAKDIQAEFPHTITLYRGRKRRGLETGRQWKAG